MPLAERCLVNLAKALGLKVVAEGVETEGQRRILQEFGCDQLQGYLFAKPMPERGVAEFLAKCDRVAAAA